MNHGEAGDLGRTSVVDIRGAERGGRWDRAIIAGEAEVGSKREDRAYPLAGVSRLNASWEWLRVLADMGHGQVS